MAFRLGSLILVFLCGDLVLTEDKNSSEDKNYKCSECISLLDACYCGNCTEEYVKDEFNSSITLLADKKEGHDSLAETIIGTAVGGIFLGSIIPTFIFLCLRRSEQRKQKSKDRSMHSMRNPAYDIEEDNVAQNDKDDKSKQIVLYSEINDELLKPTKDSEASFNKNQKDDFDPHVSEDGFHAYNHLHDGDKIHKGHLYDHVAKPEPSAGSADELGAMSLTVAGNDISSEKDECNIGKQFENKSAGQYYVLEKGKWLSA